MSKRSFRIALGVVAGTVAIALIVSVVLLKQALSYPTKAHKGQGGEVSVEIRSGMSFPTIAEALHEKGVVDKPLWFRLYAMHRGATTKVRKGAYTLRDNMTPEEVLDELLKGVKEETVRVTIPEGRHFLEVFDIIDEAGVADKNALIGLARDGEFLRGLGIGAETIEGYLLPETYDFAKPTKPERVIKKMVQEHRKVWAELRQKHQKSVAKLSKKLEWSEHDLLIMASIVEKEAVVDEERSRIAQTFINRLVSPKFVPHRLDTDPTIRYGCMVPEIKSEPCKKWDESQRLRRAQLDDKDNPYNTYQHEGLPPGPICNPGREAIEATMTPDGSNYFFFVSRNDGTHVFSATRAQHERAVDKFQRNK
jgi:UPF0755 protein